MNNAASRICGSSRRTRRTRRCAGSARWNGARPAHGHQMHELGSVDVMRLDQTLGLSRHVACASSCISMRTSLEEGIKLHRFAGIFPEQFFTEAGRHREAVVAADQRMVIRCFGDDLTGFVHDVSHVPPPIQRAALLTLHSGDIIRPGQTLDKIVGPNPKFFPSRCGHYSPSTLVPARLLEGNAAIWLRLGGRARQPPSTPPRSRRRKVLY
jgi:hypothetical protein